MTFPEISNVTGIEWGINNEGYVMPTMTLELPDEVAEAIKDKGMLTSTGVTELLREALRSQALEYIADFVTESETRGIAPFGEGEIEAEIHLARKRRQA